MSGVGRDRLRCTRYRSLVLTRRQAFPQARTRPLYTLYRRRLAVSRGPTEHRAYLSGSVPFVCTAFYPHVPCWEPSSQLRTPGPGGTESRARGCGSCRRRGWPRHSTVARVGTVGLARGRCRFVQRRSAAGAQVEDGTAHGSLVTQGGGAGGEWRGGSPGTSLEALRALEVSTRAKRRVSVVRRPSPTPAPGSEDSATRLGTSGSRTVRATDPGIWLSLRLTHHFAAQTGWERFHEGARSLRAGQD